MWPCQGRVILPLVWKLDVFYGWFPLLGTSWATKGGHVCFIGCGVLFSESTFRILRMVITLLNISPSHYAKQVKQYSVHECFLQFPCIFTFDGTGAIQPTPCSLRGLNPKGPKIRLKIHMFPVSGKMMVRLDGTLAVYPTKEPFKKGRYTQ